MPLPHIQHSAVEQLAALRPTGLDLRTIKPVAMIALWSSSTKALAMRQLATAGKPRFAFPTTRELAVLYDEDLPFADRRVTSFIEPLLLGLDLRHDAVTCVQGLGSLILATSSRMVPRARSEAPAERQLGILPFFVEVDNQPTPRTRDYKWVGLPAVCEYFGRPTTAADEPQQQMLGRLLAHPSLQSDVVPPYSTVLPVQRGETAA